MNSSFFFIALSCQFEVEGGTVILVVRCSHTVSRIWMWNKTKKIKNCDEERSTWTKYSWLDVQVFQLPVWFDENHICYFRIQCMNIFSWYCKSCWQELRYFYCIHSTCIYSIVEIFMIGVDIDHDSIICIRLKLVHVSWI